MSPHRPHTDQLPNRKNEIGTIFRKFGEQYIKIYKPYIDHIKFIRAVRVCKTPALGGTLMQCKSCEHQHTIYFSCGHARCPICQSIKREQWVDKMKNSLLDVPYIHVVTTMPHELNRLARKYPKIIYNLIFRATQKTIWKITKDPAHLGAKPGMVCILHTWGSDLRYHIHVHSMVTFGGMDQLGNWQFPKHKKRLCRNSKLRFTYSEIFLKELEKLYKQKAISFDQTYEQITNEIKDKSWSVHATHPTMDTDSIEKYLARYINRIAVTNSRVKYIRELRKVHLIHNDYRQQIDGQSAPKKTKVIEPLSFIHHVLQHLPPPYFQRTRRYGLHANSKSKEAIKLIEQRAKYHGRAIRTVCEIITQLMKLDPLVCQACRDNKFSKHILIPDKSYIFNFITLPKIRSPG